MLWEAHRILPYVSSTRSNNEKLTLFHCTELIATLLNDGTHPRTGVQLLKPDTVRGRYLENFLSECVFLTYV